MLNPSYKSGFAPRDGIPRYPSLWRGCVGAWCPGLGPSGSVLHDWSGRKNHGTLTNMDLGAAWQPGALAFDGTDDYLALNKNMPIVQPMCIAFWLMATNNRTQGFLTSGGIGAGTPYYLARRISDGSITVYRYNGYYTSATGLTSVGSWFHFAIQWENSSASTAWVNGAKVLDMTAPAGGDNIGTYIGVDAFATNPYWLGQADDMRLYDRALSQTEISLLATRRRIAYELAPRSFALQSATGNRRRRYLIGCS